jgi:hypothetical protein
MFQNIPNIPGGRRLRVASKEVFLILKSQYGVSIWFNFPSSCEK